MRIHPSRIPADSHEVSFSTSYIKLTALDYTMRGSEAPDSQKSTPPWRWFRKLAGREDTGYPVQWELHGHIVKNSVSN